MSMQQHLKIQQQSTVLYIHNIIILIIYIIAVIINIIIV